MNARTLLIGAGAAVLAFLVLLVHEVKRVPDRAYEVDKGSVEPLTDVTGRSRLPGRPTVVAPTPPPHRVAADGQKVVEPAPYILPNNIDPARPRQWTKPLAVPGVPTPPDPRVQPDVAQDPNRGGRTQ